MKASWSFGLISFSWATAALAFKAGEMKIFCQRCKLEIEPGESYEYLPGGLRQHQLQRCYDLLAAQKDEAVNEHAKALLTNSLITGDRDGTQILLDTAVQDLKDMAAELAKVKDERDGLQLKLAGADLVKLAGK